jgi:hypothetical protein
MVVVVVWWWWCDNRPVNEGAVVVSPFSSKLTPVGQVMQLLSAHTAGALLTLPAAAYSGDLDTLATVAARCEN